MKKPFLLEAVLIFSSLCAHAGNFGPAPFRNGSPLVTGVDGTYQASARAENVTGIFRFAYSGGSQTLNKNQNSWIFFCNGQVLRGTVIASLNQSSLNGVLDSTAQDVVRDSNGTVTLPLYFFSGGDSASGDFHGKLELKSPAGAFSGSGQIKATPATQNTLTAIYRVTDQASSGNYTSTYLGNVTTSTNRYQTGGGTIDPIYFKFRGVRLSTSASSAATTN